MRNFMKIRLPLAILALALAPLAAPLLAASHPMATLFIRSFFLRLCHQDPARSFVLGGTTVAVCVRCLGIYCGPPWPRCCACERRPRRKCWRSHCCSICWTWPRAGCIGTAICPCRAFFWGCCLGLEPERWFSCRREVSPGGCPQYLEHFLRLKGICSFHSRPEITSASLPGKPPGPR